MSETEIEQIKKMPIGDIVQELNEIMDERGIIPWKCKREKEITSVLRKLINSN